MLGKIEGRRRRGQHRKRYLDDVIDSVGISLNKLIKDLSNVKAYSEVPFTVKVKSARAETNAVKLITALMEKKETIKKSTFNKVDVIDILKKI